MKMVKSLLLGTATGFATIAGAQAADLPGKAAPAEYVRICDTYGAGFFFIPGTDTCLRIGGFVRADYTLSVPRTGNVQTAAGAAVAGNQGGSPVPGTNLSRAAFDNDTGFQSRFAINFDARSNTEYGLLRSFAQFTIRRGESTGFLGSGVNNVANGSPRQTIAVMDRAFIQFAGFTFGYTASFFNFYQGDVSLSPQAIPTVARVHATNLLAYTASFGQGFSATLSLEDRRTQEIGNLDQTAASTAAIAGGPGATAATLGLRPFSGLAGLTYGPQSLPDVVLNLRVDQGWGSAQLMGAIRQIKDYGYAGIVSTAAATAPTATAGDRYGWAIGGGIRINLDQIARGDVLWLQAVYADGALSYIMNNGNSDGITANRNTTNGPFNLSQAGNVAFGYRDAAVVGAGGAAPSFAAGGSIQTTQAWGIAAGFRHFWTPNIRSSIFGSYTNVNAPLASTLPDFRIWTVGANVIWSPVRNLDIGLELAYGNIARSGTNSGPVTTGAAINPNGTLKTSDNNLVTTLRVQRNF